MPYPRHDIVVLLTQLGLDHAQAETAADDDAITWDAASVKNLLAFHNEKLADPRVENAAAILWTRLKQHHVPTPRATKPDLRILDPETAPDLCPVCHADFAVCGGMHGWAAQFRGMTPGEIYTPERPARKTRNAPYRAKNGAKEEDTR